MSVSIQFYGVAGYKIITSRGVHLVIDPFLDGNPNCPVKIKDLGQVDILLITHNAFDHFGDAGRLVREYKPVVICAVDVLHNLVKYHNADPDLIRPTIWGMAIEEKGVVVRPCESHHWSFNRTSDGQLLSGPAMGFVFDAGEGKVIYHPGDTALFSDMKLIGEYMRPTVGLMHVTLPEGEGVSLPHQEQYRCGEITPAEALVASEWLGLKEVVVSHYIDPQCDDVNAFLELVRASRRKGGYSPETIVLAPGETHVW
ncbi:MAG: MBL fold metallo-hydrolase [Desulfobacterales bacterium]|nr:MAG: MBL fold metallo-hydrolase [Desulfobacterales bacterium]